MHHHYHIKESNFDYIFTMISEFYSTFLRFYDVYYCPFTSTQRTPFSISCKAGLVVMNSLSFCLFEKAFISSSHLNDSCAG